MAHPESLPEALAESALTRRRFLGVSALAAASAASIAVVPARGAIPTAESRASPGKTCSSAALPLKDVSGKVAFITGGDSSIGLGIAHAFVDAGMKVVITYRTKAHLDEAMKSLEAAADRVHVINLDVTDRSAMEAAAAETLKVFGKVHVLGNNAGVGVLIPLSKATYDDWDWAMGVNLNGVFNGVRTFLPHIRAHGESGHIITTSSIGGLIADGNSGTYNASKFAVVGMMEALRAELDETNIGVSVFCPGVVTTNIRDSERNRPSALADTGGKPDAATEPRRREAAKEMKGPPPGMDPMDAGRRVLHGMRNNDLYILTTPELEDEIRARGEAILASLPTDLKVPESRVRLERMITGKHAYAAELERKRCEAKRG